jgi:hypothetical protein
MLIRLLFDSKPMLPNQQFKLPFELLCANGRSDRDLLEMPARLHCLQHGLAANSMQRLRQPLLFRQIQLLNPVLQQRANPHEPKQLLQTMPEQLRQLRFRPIKSINLLELQHRIHLERYSAMRQKYDLSDESNPALGFDGLRLRRLPARLPGLRFKPVAGSLHAVLAQIQPYRRKMRLERLSNWLHELQF